MEVFPNKSWVQPAPTAPTAPTSGSVQLQWGSEVNGSATQLNIGSSMLVTLLN